MKLAQISHIHKKIIIFKLSLELLDQLFLPYKFDGRGM